MEENRLGAQQYMSGPMQPKPAQDEDDALVKRAAAGDGKAFHQLIDRHGQRLFRLAVSLVGNAADAEDVLQETLAGAYRGIGKFEARASFRTWLSRILVTQAAKWRRDRARRGEGAMPEDVATESSVAASERRMDIRGALARLSAEHREVLVLREFEQLSYEEIADVLDVPRGTVESRLFRARQELKEKLKAYL
jgi:RNA polymerase sigma-70 factor, ECF subfamily